MTTGSLTYQEDIRNHLWEECRAMTEHALSTGLAIPSQIMEILARAESPSERKVQKETTDELRISMVDLNHAHQALARIVAPATPQTILLFSKEAQSNSFFRFLGKAPLVRRMMFVALTFLILFVFISLSPEVKTGGGGVLNSQGFHC